MLLFILSTLVGVCFASQQTDNAAGVLFLFGWVEMGKKIPGRGKIDRACLQCGSSFKAKRRDVERGYGKYCSKGCQNKSQENKVKITCQYCGEIFEAKPSYIKQWGAKYCSVKCSTSANDKRVIRPCQICGKKFKVGRSYLKKGGGKYCSVGCKNEGIKTRVELTCRFCNEKFTIPQSAADKTKYCSKRCFYKDRKQDRIPRNCKNCGKKIMVKPWSLNRDRGRYCSRKCAGEHRSTKVQTTCLQCANNFEVKPSHLDRGGGKFCSYECMGIWYSDHLKGENSPSWKGGTVTYYGPNWQKQRSRARKRDGYKCQGCGISEKKMGRQLDIHHIRPIREFDYVSDGPDKNDNYKEANRLSNLISLCIACHKLAEHGKIPVQPHLL